MIPKDKYRHEALEIVVGELERFDQSDFSTIMEIEKLIVDAANGIVPKDIPDSSSMEGDIDVERLKIQLLVLTDMIKKAFADTVWKVINV